ncbi:MAG: SDR family NAD(P)-dependent oxidoreductase, partial [Gemmatimonadaceae bacterium]|nr:SDR family NAD(P)-dependent oxidoreductase [Gemmatimonadaceae bacterium]
SQQTQSSHSTGSGNVPAGVPGALSNQPPGGVTAPFAVVHAFLAAMRARGSGTIVSIGTVADRTIYPHNAAYSASKYGARAVHEVLRAETRGTGVRACLIAPGPVDTPIWNRHEAALGHTLPPRDAMLRVEDVVAAVRYVVAQPPHVNIDELRLSFR